MNENEKGVIDRRQHKFAMVTKSVIDDTTHGLKAVDKLVYAILCSYADNKTRDSYPAIKTISEKASCSEHTVRRSIKKLREIRLIDVEQRYNGVGKQTSNRYVLLEPPASFELGVSNE